MIANEDGLTMILSIFIIVTLLSLVYAFNFISRSNSDNLVFATNSSKAFYGAETGIETALVYLNKIEPDLSKKNSIKGQLATVNYQVVIKKDATFKYQIISKGHYQDLSKTIIAQLESIDHNGDGQSDGLVIASWREY
ncbi:hypothetical protein [Halanaerobacter jeridensis]|uniref:Type 4 fimbrial biogenesis protein PilX N-terminal domain-containing protein n=1 Tax=Halanaerobacter jeridensis TaxID=706427 RepID=A0A939BM90_9FIRM|nr:hypothetical protein [Halanaerobacter jeridensis]MBM7555845.1 hypothetical protein [Halanaerobacter jeridensis]